MGQYWTVINIDNRESSGRLGKLGEFFWHFNPIINYLVAPNIPTCYKLRTPMEKSQTNSSGATLLTLPDELLLIIAEELVEDYLVLMCLSLTCVAMWEVTEQVRYRSLYAKLKTFSWAGGRIILLGDYGRALPDGVLTAEDIKQLKLTKHAKRTWEQDFMTSTFRNRIRTFPSSWRGESDLTLLLAGNCWNSLVRSHFPIGFV
ncbi:MAG: hypothetical protein NXY57DRAFT_651112 [Lentinula lateritia]|nr:MAG: hypothetical protein NXY57DRAFT_651112 [Lentinula lateritia]